MFAHELAHDRNHDTLTVAMTATVAGDVGLLANFAKFSAVFGDGRRNGNRDSGVGLLLVALFAPLAAGVVQMAISRQPKDSS